MNKKEKIIQRRNKLIEIVKENKFMSVTQLAYLLNISGSTVSEDVKVLKETYPQLYSKTGQEGGVGWKSDSEETKYNYIFALDPSGNFNEGKGTTGWVLIDAEENLIERGYISAKDYACAEEYWNAHLDLIHKYNRMYKSELIVVMEDYVLYRDRSKDQTNSKMETSRLIGVLQWRCWKIRQPYSMQLAVSVKQRWSDDLLLRENIIYRDGRNLIHTKSGISLGLSHTRDAFRHAIHYAVCRNKKHEKPKYNNTNYKVSNY